jgi:hypothetical protein
LISELGRLLWQAIVFAIDQRKIGLLVALVLVGAIVALSAAATVVVPVAVYPFL